MKKTKKLFGLAAALLAATTLSSCDAVTRGDEQNVIFTFTDGNGNRTNYTADQLFENNFKSNRTSAKTMFDCVYKVAVENYFKNLSDSDPLKSRIERDAQNDLDQAKTDAQNNANTNGTSYNEEFIKILSQNNATDENDLKSVYIYNHQKTEFDNLNYDKNLDGLKNGSEDGKAKVKIGDTETDTTFEQSYLNDKFPYHVRHILIKTENVGSNSFREKITSDQAKKLYKVINQLGLGNESFGQIAKENSDDTGSKENYGDLGVMDKDTQFVNEFKLGILAYDALYNREYAGNTNVTNKINIPESSKRILENMTMPGGSVGQKFLGEMKLEDFELINKVADIETDIWNSPVLDGAEDLFPRNIYYNNRLNKRYVCFITAAPGGVTSKTVGSKKCGWLAAESVKGLDSNGRDYQGGDFSNKLILTDENDYPILAFRSGTGSPSSSNDSSENNENDSENETSNDSGYKGIHLVSIVRNGFINYRPDFIKNKELSKELSQEDYWTYNYPGESGYPKKSDYPAISTSGEYLTTYVNSIKSETKDYKKKADEIKSKVKAIEESFDYKIYEALVSQGIFEFPENNKIATIIKNNIDNYILISRNEANIASEKEWEENWDKWTKNLKNENDLKTKKVSDEPVYVISETCAKWITDANHGGWAGDNAKWFNSDLFKSGGLCYVKK